LPIPPALELIPAARIPRLSASDHVAQMLKKAIVDGVLPAGEMLRQDEIASHFHVSKIPVREALKHLEAKGLVTFLPNRGVVVASLSAAEIGEYMEIRAMLEARAARLSAPLIDDEAIAGARQHLEGFALATDAGRWGELNWLFHSTLYARPSDRSCWLKSDRCTTRSNATCARSCRSPPNCPRPCTNTPRFSKPSFAGTRTRRQNSRGHTCSMRVRHLSIT
jgi:Transcriptional regulators